MSENGHTDVLVIGAGPSGSVVSDYLAKAGYTVTCLEQGRWVNPTEFPGNTLEWELAAKARWHADPNVRKTPEDYPTQVEGSDISPVMAAGVGGSSLLWSGHWMRLKPSDFRVKTLDGVADDWPISYQDLAPYYDRVDQVMAFAGIEGDPAYPDGIVPPLPPHPIGKIGRRAAEGMNKLGWHWWVGNNAIASQRYGNLDRCQRIGSCESGCPMGAKASVDLTYWPTALAAGASLKVGARVQEITVDSRGAATGAVYINRDGVRRHQSADLVVLAANGIGTPRLMMLSTSAAHPNGLANSSGLVGKRLMLHPNAEVTGVYEDDMSSWLGPAGQSLHSLEFYETDTSRGFVRGAKWNLMPTGGPLRALEARREGEYGGPWGPGALSWVKDTLGRSSQWGINSEDLPDEANCVTLDETMVDSDGIPSPRISYRISDNTRRLLRFNMDRATEAHQAAGAVRTLETPLWTDQPGHLMGTARMGDDPESSVVDRFGRAHDIANLFIVDGSVFVTSGAMNPTATICALALRTAEFIAHGAGREVA
jgi:choline dehydrogenase-like flavoprotein